MITFIRWYLAKAKAMKLRLAFYSFLEDGLRFITDNKDAFLQNAAQEHKSETSDQ